ncbi:hypothetical protein BHE74_00012969 [Ensete ventricosum]|uniref:ubiquitinyl hydrolase 1 n=1 Tax=Ensete ventricosum TaxID=4639 RepID=A0A444F9Y2_ENSVE|nr:hypothetical protein B296_00013279 [Ensete ventricosum]RWW19445.1 hypothetical protein GW17_00016505 [Ensete ventricosum]RWW78809.1 hypothetical protein BHE74_00012969 [Ensete ventricosum]RZR78579.1 hypothetical protein BHM03_00003994 [Ensete ventricosum]
MFTGCSLPVIGEAKGGGFFFRIVCVAVHCIRLPKNSTVADVINDLRTKVYLVELSHPDAELRLLEVFYHKIYKVPFLQVQNFGEPFFMVIREGETLADVKIRIQKKLQVPEEDFSKVFLPLYL